MKQRVTSDENKQTEEGPGNSFIHSFILSFFLSFFFFFFFGNRSDTHIAAGKGLGTPLEAVAGLGQAVGRNQHATLVVAGDAAVNTGPAGKAPDLALAVVTHGHRAALL